MAAKPWRVCRKCDSWRTGLAAGEPTVSTPRQMALEAEAAARERPAARDRLDLPDPGAGDEARQPVRVDDEVRQVARGLEPRPDADGAARVAEDAFAVPAERRRLPGQRDAGARRAAGAEGETMARVPDGLRAGAAVGAARPGDERHGRVDPRVQCGRDLDQREVVADPVVVRDEDGPDVDEHGVR